jgi:hypothetical protein
MLLAGIIGMVSLVSPGAVPAAPPAPSSPADTLRRPLHLPKLKRGARCPLSPSRMWSPETGQRLNGRGPVYLIGVGRADPATINMNFSFPDSQGWYAQKTPLWVSRDYGGALLVRAARIDRRGPVRFAKGYGEHLRGAVLGGGCGSEPSAESRVPVPCVLHARASARLLRLPGGRRVVQQGDRRARSRLS